MKSLHKTVNSTHLPPPAGEALAPQIPPRDAEIIRLTEIIRSQDIKIQVYAGPFQKSNHEACGKYLRHFLKICRFRVQSRNCFCIGHAILELVLYSGFQSGLQDILRWLEISRHSKSRFISGQ
jgi:hypothetical protein